MSYNKTDALDMFYKTSRFEFNTIECDCVPQEDVLNMKTKAYTYCLAERNNHFVKLAYETSKGLVRIKKDGSLDENVLGNILKIKEGDNKSLLRFFNRNGFLFNIPNQMLKIADDDLWFLLDNLKYTIDLLKDISNPEEHDYKKLFKICNYFIHLDSTSIPNTYYTRERDRTIEKLVDTHIKLQHNGRIYKTDEKYEFPVEDTSFGIVKVNRDEYHHETSPIYDDDGNEYYNDVRGAIMKHFVCNHDIPYEDRILIEFLYHSEFKYLHLNNSKVKNPSYFEHYNIEDFDEPFKKTIIETSKIILCKEINKNIKNIKPVYNYNTMSPSWNVPDLLSALYFSLFYIDPNIQILRECANPNCRALFTVSKTSKKKKYCHDRCNHAMQQRKKRAREKAEKSDNSHELI